MRPISTTLEGTLTFGNGVEMMLLISFSLAFLIFLAVTGEPERWPARFMAFLRDFKIYNG